MGGWLGKNGIECFAFGESRFEYCLAPRANVEVAKSYRSKINWIVRGAGLPWLSGILSGWFVPPNPAERPPGAPPPSRRARLSDDPRGNLAGARGPAGVRKRSSRMATVAAFGRRRCGFCGAYDAPRDASQTVQGRYGRAGIRHFVRGSSAGARPRLSPAGRKPGCKSVATNRGGLSRRARRGRPRYSARGARPGADAQHDGDGRVWRRERGDLGVRPRARSRHGLADVARPARWSGPMPAWQSPASWCSRRWSCSASAFCPMSGSV